MLASLNNEFHSQPLKETCTTTWRKITNGSGAVVSYIFQKGCIALRVGTQGGAPIAVRYTVCSQLLPIKQTGAVTDSLRTVIHSTRYAF